MNAERLRSVLRTNAILTAGSGAMLLALGGPVDTLLGTGRPGIVRFVGAALIGFAAGVALIARATPAVLRTGTKAILGADVAWVAASAATIAAGWYEPTGAAAVGAVALVVAGLAVAEASALRPRASGLGAPGQTRVA